MADLTRDQAEAVFVELLDEDDVLPDFADGEEQLAHWKALAYEAAAEILRLRGRVLHEGQTNGPKNSVTSMLSVGLRVPPGTQIVASTVEPKEAESG